MQVNCIIVTNTRFAYRYYMSMEDHKTRSIIIYYMQLDLYIVAGNFKIMPIFSLIKMSCPIVAISSAKYVTLINHSIAQVLKSLNFNLKIQFKIKTFTVIPLQSTG